MEILDLKASKEFSPTHHVYKTLAETPHSSISVVGWEPGQTSPIHSHPDADEIYHVLEGEGLNNDRSEEHTSELQSHSDLVCRLLLEKKKKKGQTDECQLRRNNSIAVE